LQSYVAERHCTNRGVIPAIHTIHMILVPEVAAEMLLRVPLIGTTRVKAMTLK